MQRRQFIKLSTAGLFALPLWQMACNQKSTLPFPFKIRSEDQSGHFLRFGLPDWEAEQDQHFKTVVVGGGVAGLSAACHLRDQDFVLLEMADRLGGTSSAVEHQQQWIGQGAHYDLAYPENFGKEVLAFLEQLKIIRYNPIAKLWQFNDRQHIIPPYAEAQYWQQGDRRPQLIGDFDDHQAFTALLSEYHGKMPLPSRLIDKEHHHLNSLSFKDFLTQAHPFKLQSLEAIDYVMRDDYGAKSDQVSALSGIHYFMCRPYGDPSVEIFSPTSGNYYFIDKMAKQLPSAKCRLQQMVVNIETAAHGYSLQVLDLKKERQYHIHCEQLIFAAPKFLLPTIFPAHASTFKAVKYSPWLVINYVLKKPLHQSTNFWQNEYITANHPLVGIVNTASHREQESVQVISLYHNYQPQERQHLLKIKNDPSEVFQFGLKAIEELIQEDITEQVATAYLHFMGHAMPIPSVGYLNQPIQSPDNLAFAGVDTFRLPLLFEAIDSGIQAAQKMSTPTI